MTFQAVSPASAYVTARQSNAGFFLIFRSMKVEYFSFLTIG